MATDKPFEQLPEAEQNRLLRKIAVQLRPMLGEIGEVLVAPRTDQKKPGFIGLLLTHREQQAILFAEYIDEPTRQDHQRKEPSQAPAAHVWPADGQYVSAILAAGKKAANEKTAVAAADSLLISTLGDAVKSTFRGFYGSLVDGLDFRIKLQAIPLKDTSTDLQAILYFASKQGDEFALKSETAAALVRLVEQLIRNALSLSAISDHELRSAVGYLTAKLPQSFNDYVIPQTLAAIYAYVREVVPVQLQATTPPRVHYEDPELSQKLESIHRASHIHVNRAVGGSLKDAQVYSITITTLAKDGDSTTSYPAIAKFSTVSEARDEADGLRKMQRYFSRIGKMLPPPLEVYLLRNPDGSFSFDKDNWLNTPCISVTPDLEGSVLSENIAKHWASPTRRVERFSGYLLQARHFVDEIQRQPFDELAGGTDPASPRTASRNEAPEQRLIDFLKSENDTRYRLLTHKLSFPSEPHLVLELDSGRCDAVNPAVWLQQMLADPSQVRWKSHPRRTPKTVLAHGDFHTGNLLYSTEGEHLTVLDYDRVIGDHPEEDFARLDASFVAFVFALDDFKQKANWDKYAPTALSLVAGRHPSTVHVLETNAFARDLVETLGVIRPAGACPFYAASVVKALLIQLKTTYTRHDVKNGYQLADNADLEKHQGRNAASWLYLALTLGHLVDKGSGDPPALWQDPYASALSKT